MVISSGSIIVIISTFGLTWSQNYLVEGHVIGKTCLRKDMLQEEHVLGRTCFKGGQVLR